MASSEQYMKYAKVLDAFMSVLKELMSPAERRLLMIRASESVDKVKWKGLSILLVGLLEGLLEEYEDAMILSILCKFEMMLDKDKAMATARKVISKIEELSEWEFDRAVSLYIIAKALYDAGERDKAKEFLEAAIMWARRVPDRSDRSISLSMMLPLLYELGDKGRAVELVDEVVYEPKRIEAVLKLSSLMGKEDNESLFRTLVSKAPRDEIPLALAAYAEALSPNNPRKVFELIKKSLNSINPQTVTGAHVMLKAFSAFKKIESTNFKNLAKQLYDKLENVLFQRIEDRPFLNVLFELLQEAAGFDSGRVLKAVSKLEDVAGQKAPPENLYMLNRIALVYAKLGDLEKAAAALELSLELSRDVDRIIAIPSIIDTGAMAVKIMNEFPATIPEELVKSYLELIQPMEYVEITVRLSKENFEFLKRAYPGLSISDAVNAVILRGRTFGSLQMEEKAKEIIQRLIDAEQYIIIHYILKYIYSIGIDEEERQSILNMLGRITELVTGGEKERAKTYLSLVFSRLERLNLPISPIVIEYMREYWLMSTLSEIY